jgi:hypothetical protein
MMNPVILQPYIGPDIKSRIVSGVIRHVARYSKDRLPLSYLVQLYPNEDGVRNGSAIVPANLIADHLKNLELLQSMDKDNE